MPGDGKTVIEVRGLAKRFGEVQAVAGIDFDVREGEVFGFLGPNGAGKTTTINMLTGLARLDAGAVRIAGTDCSKDPKAAQHLMGIVPDESNLWPELDGFENLAFCGALYGMARSGREERARELLDAFGLADAAKRKFGGYSKGMKRSWPSPQASSTGRASCSSTSPPPASMWPAPGRYGSSSAACTSPARRSS